MGKRGYPSAPEVYDVPIMVRFPGAEHAGTVSDMLVQHHDIPAAILDALNVEPSQGMDGLSFLDDALAGRSGKRDHATVAWGSASTVITPKWWYNGKVDGSGALLHDLEKDDPFAQSEANEHPDVVNELHSMAVQDAKGDYPEWLVDLARNQADAPGCSDLAARVV